MKRLTKRITKNLIEVSVKSKSKSQIFYLTNPFWKVFDKLAHYEDLEEQGLLHIAPLKDGTPIWYFMYGFDEETYVVSTTYLFSVTEYEIGELGKEFWSSEEEAEAKLKEMEGK